MAGERVLSARELNRALLARQGLLEREARPALEMVEQLVGLQAQVPSNPYVALWSRLDSFDPAELSTALEERRAVRAGLMRNTIHLVSARDCLAIQPLTMPVLHATFRAAFSKQLHSDTGEVAAAAAEMLGEPLTRAEVGERLAPRYPGEHPALLGHTAAHHLPLVHATPRGLWQRSGQTRLVRTDAWLDGATPDGEPSLDDLVLRYLRAFGPATSADLRTWCRITGLREVIERLRGQLRAFRDERGRELLDVPDGPLPDLDVPAPPRFLPEYDNALLSHEDRSRVFAGKGPDQPFPRGTWIGTLLADGFYRGNWSAAVDDEQATLTVDRFTPRPDDPPRTREAIEAEGLGLLALIAAGRQARVVFQS